MLLWEGRRMSSQYLNFCLQYLTSNTVADDQYEHAHVREEDIRENFPDWLETFLTVQKLSKMSKKLPDCPENLPDCPENLSGCPETFRTVQILGVG